MFWDWWNDLCEISSEGNGLASMYFFDKVYKSRDGKLEDYLDIIRELNNEYK